MKSTGIKYNRWMVKVDKRSYVMPNTVWLDIIVGERLLVTDAIKDQLYDNLKNNIIPILACPSLTDNSVLTNRCAIIRDVEITSIGIRALLEPAGNKAKIFKTMIDADQYPIQVKLIGKGNMDKVNGNNRLRLNEINYISFSFSK